jgi:ribosomal protein L7/L12
MNCQTCKNPIKTNSKECEWCGSDLANSNKIYSVILLDSRRITATLVNEIRNITGLGLAESNKIASSRNSIVFTTEDFNKAEIIKNKLESCEASIIIK